MRLRDLTPPEMTKDASRLLLTGREEAVIEGHRGLFSYETRCVRVRCREGIWTLTGENLTIDFFGAQDMKITGRIDGIEVNGDL